MGLLHCVLLGLTVDMQVVGEGHHERVVEVIELGLVVDGHGRRDVGIYRNRNLLRAGQAAAVGDRRRDGVDTRR